MTTMVKTISNMVKVVDLQLSPAEYLVVRSALVKKWQPYMATRIHEFEKELYALPPVTIAENATKEFEHLEWLLEKHYKAKPEQKQWAWIKKWRGDTYYGYYEYVCTKCGCGEDTEFDYCPNCGAKMEVGDENSN